jgi:hypothetical protein
MLEGRGSGWLAKLRLCLMREMLVIAGELIKHDRINAACFTLQRAYMRCDGDFWPLPDFVVGDAVPELAEMIQTLRTSLEDLDAIKSVLACRGGTIRNFLPF